ncbi:MAG: glucosaminidase domain-containing protein [Erysipelotrichales bacterium]
MKKINKIMIFSIAYIFIMLFSTNGVSAADESIIKFPNLNKTCNIYPKATNKDSLTYTNPQFQHDAPYLGESNGYYKTMISGVMGYIPKSCVPGAKVQKVSKTPSFGFTTGNKKLYGLDVSRYQVVGNKMYFGLVYGGNITYNIGYTDVPKGLSNNKVYYSYDGIYYYTNYNTMVANYKSKVRTNAANAANPYYDYYQYVPMRTTSNISGAYLDKRLLQIQPKSSNNLKQSLKFRINCSGTPKYYNSNYNGYYSNAYKQGNNFYNKQNTHKVNAGMLYGIMINESANGTSNFSRHYNNPFGWGAYDSCPNSATRYSSMASAIDAYYKNMSNQYANPVHDFGGKGTNLGNKQAGANVKYASDPHWGYKNAYNYRKADEVSGNKDKNKYKIGIIKSNKNAVDGSTANERVKVYTSASTSSKSPYYYERNNASVVILGTSGNFYKVQKDNAPNAGAVYIPKTNIYQVNTPQSVPKPVKPSSVGVTYTKSGNNHYIYGLNNKGQMGNGNTTNVASTNKINLNTKIAKGEKIKSVVYNNNNVFILTTNGNVYSSGDNAYGQRSFQGQNNKFTRVFSANRKITSIALSGNRLSMKILGTNDYFYVGQNSFNPTVNKFNRNFNNPIRVRYSKGSKVDSAWYYERNNTGRVAHSYKYNSKYITAKYSYTYYKNNVRATHRTFKYTNGVKSYSREIKYSSNAKATAKTEWYYVRGALKTSGRSKAIRYNTTYKNGKAKSSIRQYYTTKGKLQKSTRVGVRK